MNGRRKAGEKMKAIVNGRILLPDREISGKALLFEDRIAGTADPGDVRADEIIDAEGAYVAPGLIDTHIHGYMGDDASDGDAEELRRMAARLTENGVTAFLPTTMTVPRDQLETAFRQIRRTAAESREPGFRGAEIAGCHAEGPFISPVRKGAQVETAILPPDPVWALGNADIVRVMTFAPEMPGAEEMIREIVRDGRIRLSIGHTDATYEQAMRAVSLGAERFTHLFNAMPPVHHRLPGTAGAALAGGAWTEVIADGFHIHPGMFPMLHRALRNRLVLITDCVRAGGMPDGEYTLGGQTFSLRGAECRLPDGTIAGSVLKMNEAVRNYRDFAGIPMYEAVRAATLNAAESAGLADTRGSLTPGKQADIVLLDDSCNVRRTIIRGRTVRDQENRYPG